MNYNIINGIKVSQMGVGIMRHNPDAFSVTQEIIDECMANGVNYFESCAFYLNWECQSILGKALSKYDRESFLLAGKFPLYGMDWSNTNFKEFILQQMKECQVDYFDFYLIQALDRACVSLMKQYSLLDAILELKAEGKIKAVGFSFHDTPEYFEYYLKEYNCWDFAQIQLNYYDWYFSHGKELYQLSVKYNIPLFIMGPLKGGIIADRLPENIKAAYENSNMEKSIVNMAFNFLGKLSNVKMILSGAQRLDYMQENLSIFNNPTFGSLTKQDVDILKTIMQFYQKQAIVQCTGCGYCVEHCSLHIDIPKTFSLYNKAICHDEEARKELISMSKIKGSYVNCKKCRQCEKHCPQKLPIASLMGTQLFAFRS